MEAGDVLYFASRQTHQLLTSPTRRSSSVSFLVAAVRSLQGQPIRGAGRGRDPLGAAHGETLRGGDFVGVGLGPSNLSLAALTEPLAGVRCLFLERRARFEWHSGLMLPDAQLQVSFLKDLVTLVDPTSAYSFLSFLAVHGRLYRFIVRGDEPVSRREYAHYYSWVAEKLSSTRFDARVDEIEHLPDRGFRVRGNRIVATARNLVLGTGRTPSVPPCAEAVLGPRVLHSSDFLHSAARTAGARVLVVGGGQSGAEIVAHLLDERVTLARSVTWLSSRESFLPLDRRDAEARGSVLVLSPNRGGPHVCHDRAVRRHSDSPVSR